MISTLVLAMGASCLLTLVLGKFVIAELKKLRAGQEIRKEGVKNPFDGGQYEGFENAILTRQKHCREVCNEALDELMDRAPGLITSQYIAVKGVKYNLLSMDNWKKDWEVILEGV